MRYRYIGSIDRLIAAVNAFESKGSWNIVGRYMVFLPEAEAVLKYTPWRRTVHFELVRESGQMFVLNMERSLKAEAKRAGIEQVIIPVKKRKDGME